MKQTFKAAPISEYPVDYIPAGGKEFIGHDKSEKDYECTVRGFYKDGEYHIQEVTHHRR